jgi:hypothetical protein
MVFHSTLTQKISNSLLEKTIKQLEGLVPLRGQVTSAAVVAYPGARELARFQFAPECQTRTDRPDKPPPQIVQL